MASLLTGLPLVMLTSTGAKSGLPRTVPLLAIRRRSDSDQFAVVATNWGQGRRPSWYYNLKADPRATCIINGATGAYLAYEVYGEVHEQYWQAAADTYAGYLLYEKRIGGRHIPIMVLFPQRPKETGYQTGCSAEI